MIKNLDFNQVDLKKLYETEIVIFILANYGSLTPRKADKEIIHGDKTIRSYILARTWEKNPEFLLVRQVVKNLTKKNLN